MCVVQVCSQPVALHVIHAGSAIHGGRILTKGSVWGEDVLVAAAHLRSRLHARATTYLEAFYITRDAIFKAAGGFEDTLQHLRRAARLLALRRYVVLVAKVTRNAQLLPSAAKPSAPPQRRAWKRAMTKNCIATDVRKEISDLASASFKKRDFELTFEERYERSQEKELVRALFLVSEDIRLDIGDPPDEVVAEGSGGGGSLMKRPTAILKPKQPAHNNDPIGRRVEYIASEVAKLCTAVAAVHDELRTLSTRPKVEQRLMRQHPSRVVRQSRVTGAASSPTRAAPKSPSAAASSPKSSGYDPALVRSCTASPGPEESGLDAGVSA